MSRKKVLNPHITIVAARADLLPWEREALAALSTISAEARAFMLGSCVFIARREAARKEEVARPVLRLISGGRP
jgi:hypothetical protein